MLELRPNCEGCDKDLPPNANDAYICSYECTFCAHCVEHLLSNVCPNCGGGFSPRPIRPETARRANISLIHHPAFTLRIHTNHSLDDMKIFAAAVKDIKPEER